MVTVSVIVPVYNGSPYIEVCVENLKRQTLSNIEIIFVDDGSTDNSLEILHKYESEVVHVLHQENCGAGAARNNGLKHASGEYIAFLDVDDVYVETTSLEKLYKKAIQQHALICGGSLQAEGVEISPTDQQVFTKETWIDFFDYQFDYGFTQFIYNTNFIKQNDILFPAYHCFEDPVFLLKAMSIAKHFYVIPDVVYLYKGTPRSGFTTEKTIDYLKGLRDNLRRSSEFGYANLHYRNFQRLEKVAAYQAECLLPNDDQRLFIALLDANAAIDLALLRDNGVTLPTDYVLPTLSTVWRASNKYFRLRKVPNYILRTVKNFFIRH